MEKLIIKNNIIKYIFILFYIFIFSCNDKYTKISKILNVDDIEVENYYSIDNDFGGFGEGYSLEIYKLQKNTIDLFIKSNKYLPVKNDKKWLKKDWFNQSIDKSYNEIILMNLNYTNGNKKLETIQKNIQNNINNFYVYKSFYYYPNKENPRNTILYVLNIKENNLYIIESSF